MKVTRLLAGEYRADALPSGKVYVIEDVSEEAGRRLWSVSEERDGVRLPPCDAFSSLAEAKRMLAGWE